MALVLSPHSASAQYPGSGGFSVTYTGNGSQTVTNPTTGIVGSEGTWDTTPTGGYLKYNGPNDFGSFMPGSPPYGYLGSGALTDQGTITPMFTWAGTGPAPSTLQAVIYGQAASYGCIKGNTGQANDGLGDTAVVNSSISTGEWVSAGYHVETISLSNGVGTYPVTLSASDGDPYSGTSVEAIGSPATITLAGTTLVNGAWDALAGQQIKATFNVPVGTVTSRQWSASPSGNLFKTYNSGLASNQVVPLSDQDGDFDGSNFYFYDVTNDDKVTVTCTANVTFPDGTTGTVTATAPPITFVKPTAVWTVKEGYVQEFSAPGTQYANDLLFGLAADPAYASTYPRGEDWYNVGFTMPSGFSATGQGFWTQLWTPDRRQYAASTGTTPPYQPGQGLDNTFEIALWSLPSLGNAGDSPNIGINPDAPGYAPETGDYYSANDFFNTWLMYQPPSVSNLSTVPAPVKSYGWSFAATVTWDESDWVLSNGFPSTGSSPGDPSLPTDTLPQWSRVLTNSGS